MAPFCRKQRTCRYFSGATYFKPRGIPLRNLEINTLELDELEAIHLCDHEDLEQREAAEKMNISTSTLQRLLYSGRKKIIDALYNSKAIEITKHELIVEKNKNKNMLQFKNNYEDTFTMKKIIIPNDNGLVSEHFGHSLIFTLFEIEGNQIVRESDIDAPGHQPGMLPKFFHEKEVDLVITAGMGNQAIELFNSLNIKVIVGAHGPIKNVIRQFLEGKLQTGDSTCSDPHKNCQHDFSCRHEEKK